MLKPKSNSLDKRIREAKAPIVASFSQPGCKPCKVQSGYLLRLRTELRSARVHFIDVDLAESPELAGRYGIRQLPSTLVFVDGRENSRHEGLTDPGSLACKVLVHVEDGAEHMARTGNICPLN